MLFNKIGMGKDAYCFSRLRLVMSTLFQFYGQNIMFLYSVISLQFFTVGKENYLI